MSLFISFEGGEGTGKTTQAEELRVRLEEAGTRVVAVREPGSTRLGDYLREWLKRERGAPTPHVAELFLFAAARSALVREVIKPALKHPNTVVVSDRFADSTTAYQGYGRGIPLRDIRGINRLASEGIMPNLTILFDCPPAQGLMRLDSAQGRLPMDLTRRAPGGRFDQEGTRRFEEEPLDFHERVRAGYLKLAGKEQGRWRVIDATGSVKQIAGEVWGLVQERLASSEESADIAPTWELPLWANDSPLSSQTP